MHSRLRAHLTYANVVSTVCLFILLGGSAYAALKVTGKNVKNSSLTGQDVKNNSLTGKDVKSLGAADFKGGALPAGPRGATGPAGPQGPSPASAFAAVGANGQLSFGRGVQSSNRGNTTGQFVVTFTRSVRRCAFFVSRGYGDPSQPGDANGPDATLAANPLGEKTISVITKLGAVDTYLSFFVSMYCES